MPNIRDIAKAANVSKSTVALALNGDSRCAETTAKRVQAVANSLGYRPNPMVAANMANMRKGARKRKIRANLAYFYDIARGLPRTMQTYVAARQRAAELGFALEAFPYNAPKLKPDRLQRMLRHRGIQGILISDSSTPIPHIEFNFSGFAIAAIGYTLQNPRVDRVGYDHVENMRILFNDLQARGYRRAGLALRQDIDHRIAHLLSARYLGYQHERALIGNLPLYIGAVNWCPETFLSWLLKYKPDCLITVGSEIRSWLEDAGFSIPRDLGLVSIWGQSPIDTERTNYYRVSMAKLARIAIDVISNQLNSNQRGVPSERRSILVSSEYIDNGSLRPLPLESPAGLAEFYEENSCYAHRSRRNAADSRSSPSL